MTGDSFSPEEQALIQRLQRVPKARLSVRTKDAIRERMFIEMDAPVAPRPVSRPPVRRMWFAIGAAAAVTLIIAGMLLTTRPPEQTPLTGGETHVAAGNTETPTVTPSHTEAIDASATPTPSHTAPAEATDTAPVVVVTVAPTMTASTEPTDTPAPAVETATPAPTLAATDTASPTVVIAEPTATPTPETVLEVEGRIERIQGNTITIYGIDIAIAEGNPILNIIEVGDVVRVEGSFDDEAGFAATVVENLLDDDADTATVVVDGPIEAINGEYVTVNGIELDFTASTAALRTLTVGDFLSVRGNIETRGGRFVLAVVSIEVQPNITIVTPAGCEYHEPGMGMGMGHWHCDGMGMGMGMGLP